jgi:hypothetical protein
MPLRSPKAPQWPHEYVFAASTCATGFVSHGVDMPVRLRAGQTWDANDELVKQRPELFAGEVPDECIMRTTPDPARLEAALATARLAAEVAEADRNAPTSTLLPY